MTSRKSFHAMATRFDGLTLSGSSIIRARE